MRRLWLALHFTDLSSADSLTQLVTGLALAPARKAWGLRPPTPGERDDFLFEDAEPILGLPTRTMRRHSQQISAAHFDPVVRGMMLFGWLFPGGCLLLNRPDKIAELPGSAFLSHSQALAYRTYEEIAYLVSGLFGKPTDPPLYHGIAPYEPQANEAALTEMRAMQKLIGRAVGAPEDFGDYRRIDLGFNAIDPSVVMELDDILRRDVHARAAWLGDFELANPDDDAEVSTPLDLITFDRGVLSSVVPEALSGLIALDFVESLRLDRAAGRCHRCRQPMLLTPQQGARSSRGEPVFHPDCHEEHRYEYGRNYQRRRLVERRQPPGGLP
jgi:hypothetical protein